jgi:LemA protein
MSDMGILLLVLLAGAGLAYLWYTKIIGRRNTALEALSSIDVQLRKRHDLIPNLVAMAKRFMTHERELLDRLTEQRAKAAEPYSRHDPRAVEQHLADERALQSSLVRVLAVAENYPDLKSDRTVIEVQEGLEEVEGHIAAARRFYNSAVTDLNNSVQIFPGNIIAGWAKVEPMPYFELEDSAMRAPVDVGALMDKP